METDELFAFLHVLAAFWYVIGLTAVQVPLARGWRAAETSIKADSFEEAAHYQGVLLVPGAIAAAATGLFFWARLDYNLVATGWLVLLEALYVFTLLVCLPLTGLGLRRVRLAALKARKRGGAERELDQAMADGVPLVFSGLATILVPVMTFLSVFRPF